MARTQAEDYDERREEIVEEAARLFAKRGFLGASVAELAEACGVSKSAIYHYYPSKEDILFDVMYSHVVALKEAEAAAMSPKLNAAQRLRALARAFMSLYVGAANRHKVLLNELDQLPRARRSEIVSIQRGLIDAVAELLAAIEPELLRTRRGRPAAMLFFGMINWTHTWFDAKGAMSAAALADMAVDLTLDGLRSSAFTNQ